MEGLYRTPRTYFDSGCDEYQTYPIEQKLLDIGFATWYGYDIKEDIQYILKNYSYVSESDIQRALWHYMAYINKIRNYNYLNFNRNNHLNIDVDLVIEDLMRVFRLPNGERNKAYLARDSNNITFRELDAMNEWKKAIEDYDGSPMYSFGNWIMYPGDGKIIRRFNLNEATQEKGYISYVYPEPWYGGPAKAKVIVLGNEARYDDFVSRIQNLMLRANPAYAEGVAVTVNSWFQLERFDFYNPVCVDNVDNQIATLDVYNSPTYRYWLTEFRYLRDILNLDIDYDFYSKIAVINANPYPSIGAEPLAAGMLPSHYFLRQLVRYIVINNPDVQFIIPAESLCSVWKKILGDVYNIMEISKRVFVLDKIRSKYTFRNLTKEQRAVLRHKLMDKL